MTTKEIVSLQLGHYANFVGTHFWNIQESSFVYTPSQLTGPKEICHGVLYREGENRSREVTFTPRLVAFDLKGSLKSLKQEGVLYDTATGGEEVQWLGDVTLHNVDSVKKNMFLMNMESGQEFQTMDIPSTSDIEDEKFDDSEKCRKKKKTDEKHITNDEDIFTHKPYNLDSQVYVWSDFLGTCLHPKTIHIIEEYRHMDEMNSFDLFTCASEVLSNYEHTCEWEDRIHYFTEECDNLQGFQVSVDMHNGFGGIAEGLLKYLEDDYPGKGILTFGFTPSDVVDNTPQARATRIINSALVFEKVSSLSSLFVPTSLAQGLWQALMPPVVFPHLSYRNVPYHTSAILASCLDTMSLPYRLETGAINMKDITHSFNAYGRQIAALYTAMPIGLCEGESFMELLSYHVDKFLWQSVTPHAKIETTPFIQSVVMRGITDALVPSSMEMSRLPEYLRTCETKEELLTNYLQHKCHGSLFAINCLESSQKTVLPYPHIFKETVNRCGKISQLLRPEHVAVESVPMMTSLQCTSEVGTVLQSLLDSASKLNIKKQHRFLSSGLEEDEYLEVLDKLNCLKTCYKTNNEAL